MGGTIAGTGSASGVGYQAGQIAAQDLLGGIAVPAGCVVRPQQVRQLDSKDIGDGDWLALAQACGQQLADPQVAAVVITHGTGYLGRNRLVFAVRAACGQAGGIDLCHAPGQCLIGRWPGQSARCLGLCGG